jgi:hypothetical protein
VHGIAAAPRRLVAFDSADALEYHRVVSAVRPARERRANTQRGAFGAGKQQSVAAEIAEVDALHADALRIRRLKSWWNLAPTRAAGATGDAARCPVCIQVHHGVNCGTVGGGVALNGSAKAP